MEVPIYGNAIVVAKKFANKMSPKNTYESFLRIFKGKSEKTPMDL